VVNLRERVRAELAARDALKENPWPQGTVPFAVDQLIEAGRVLDRAALVGQAIDTSKAREVVETLAAYVASLPTAQQPHVASRLVAALAERQQFRSAVPLKTRREEPEPALARAELEW